MATSGSTTPPADTPPRRGRLAALALCCLVACMQAPMPVLGQSGGRVVLGSPGAYWYPTKVPVAAGFVVAFQFTISNRGGSWDANGYNGGDGIAFVVQAAGADARGGTGADIGYGGIARSLAVEFDTFFNEHDGAAGRDDGSNHVSVHTRGALPNSPSHRHSLASTQMIPELSDGKAHYAIIEWRGDGELKVFLDNCGTPVLSTRITVADALGGSDSEAWIGFTAATGVAWEHHEILNWRFASLPASYPALPLCDGDTVRFSAPPGFDWYEWSTFSGERVIAVSDAGTYRLIVGFDGPCRYTLTAEYVVYRVGRTRPRISGNTFLCPDSTTELDAGPGYVSYRWTTGERSRTIRVRGPALVAVETVDEAGCTGRSDTVQVGLRRLPVPVIRSEGPLTLCDGDSVVLDAGAGFLRYRWSGGQTGRYLVVREEGWHSVLVTDSAGCSAQASAVHVGVGARPTPVAAASDTLLCAGQSALLSASGARSCRWAPSDGLDCDTCAVTAARPSRSTTYVVTARSLEGCDALDSVRINVVDRSAADAGRDTAICAGDSVRLAGRGGGTYRWEPTDGLSCASCPDPIATPALTTLYRLHVDETGDCAATDSVVVIVAPPPVVDAGEAVTICAGETAQLAARGADLWRWEPSEGLSCTDCAAPSARPSATTLYRVVGTSAAGCASSDSVLVTVTAPPIADAGVDVEICAGAGVRLGASGGESYAWSPPDGLDCLDCAAPMASPDATTRYHVVVTSAAGCSDTDEVTVSVRESGELALSIERTLRVRPGDSVLVPVMLDRRSMGTLPDGALEITIAVDPRVARIGRVQSAGTLLEGAIVSTTESEAGKLVLRVDGARSGGGGQTLMAVAIAGYIGSVDTSAIDVRLAVLDPDACVAGGTARGLLRIDSICGLQDRLFEVLEHAWALRPARPNPFNPTTLISVVVAIEAPVRIVVTDAAGRDVAVLADAVLRAGEYGFTFDAGALPSGLYTCRLSAPGYVATRTLMLLR